MASPFEITKNIPKVIKMLFIATYGVHASCNLSYLILGEREMVDKIQAMLFFMQFSTRVGGDENWRRQLRRTW
jgi:hypothetical protein